MSEGLDVGVGPEKTAEIAARVEAFVRNVVTAASAHAKERAASLPRLIRLARQSMEACR